MKVTGSKDFWAGLMFIAFGLGFIVVARDYAMGSAVRMGPAYFPTVLGGLLAALGLVIGGRAFVAAGERLGHFALRPTALVLLSVVLFALALRPIGLVGATLILIFVGALGGAEFEWREVALIYLVLIGFSVAAFYYGLGLPFQLWPAFVGR
ncbi:MAG: tripartite tricarboxylate transporter TctB family protein [Burkholderiales bacterium]|nr:tripartite tricarboxylate transporter TctB family protein [Burkholderiales bacterium]